MLYIFALLKSLQGTVCDLLDCSECLGGCSIAVQFWEIHCIGYNVLPSLIRLWWLRGAIIRPAAEAQQRIVYRLDRTPPTLRCPTGVIAYIYGCKVQGSVWVSFPVSATDNCDSAPQLLAGRVLLGASRHFLLHYENGAPLDPTPLGLEGIGRDSGWGLEEHELFRLRKNRVP